MRADRLSWQLTEAQCCKIIDASYHAWAAGMPFNRFITLAWDHGGIDPTASVTATGEFVKLGRDWHYERGHPMPWAWVQECGPRLGAHCHLLLHVSPDLDPLFGPMPRRWASKVLGGVYVAGVVDTDRLRFAATAEANPAAYEAHLLGRVSYMLKCAPAALEAPLGLLGWGHKPWGQTCPVYGKRAAGWQAKAMVSSQWLK